MTCLMQEEKFIVCQCASERQLFLCVCVFFNKTKSHTLNLSTAFSVTFSYLYCIFFKLNADILYASWSISRDNTEVLSPKYCTFGGRRLAGVGI